MPRLVKIINIALPVLAITLVSYYQTCGSTCSYMEGTILGVDLAIAGILFMTALLVLNFPIPLRIPARTALLSGALGGEVILIHFQFTRNLYCPYCIAFAVLVAILFVVNVRSMSRWLVFCSFAAGMGLFILFFQGSLAMPGF